ncbi:DUF123 domain-containing protein [Saccharolobus solfataricus]|uniref:DUF123 domain-containing protein n=3 Tax=Saccharolobus solfataricus TaxID=2287 RepID=Q97U25_SACS2|nr:DUF123 domain-containing protein [Saccharolobus solfataricus]AAK43297.1 Conserved hypothetical protein [Saccharolobus solfataricus P2]AKA73319.1 DUF123 domain-containing protein [Saccharolobus solfataricus]AKA76018.1 DUF123 domain-containing protein [Saccharolobus solfataricus]AKA78711.1 DUF123 domain-containing protein [Saccharolobus solfataricus]AZF67786.1 DUF123 domain-containing protein [Saccharolobus solfataricus]
MKSYILLIKCKTDTTIRTKSKKFLIRKGVYAYVGSCGRSCGRRVSRHFNKEKSNYHWHIDYLTKACEPIGVFVMNHVGEKELALLFSKNNAFIEEFGSSDDKDAKSHLFIVNDLQELCSTVCDKSRER